MFFKTGQLGQKQGNKRGISRLDLNETDILRLVQVACGFLHTLFLTADGVVLSSGKGSLGRLGHGDQSVQRKPKPIGKSYSKAKKKVYY